MNDPAPTAHIGCAMTTWFNAVILFAQGNAADGGGGAGGGGWPLGPYIPFIMIGVLFYVMLIRPERRKRAELDTILRSLKKNDRVVTIGGMLGTVVQAGPDGDEVTLRVDDSNNTRIRVLRSSISRVLASESPTEAKSS